MSRLQNKVALITGGANGLGEAIAQRMAEVEAVVIENNVTAHVLSLVKINDKALPFDELMTA